MDIYQRYLSTLLWLRLPRAAFAVSERWAKSKDESKATVALDLQFRLIEQYGYHECPHCHGATRKELQHVSNPAHPCWKAHLHTLIFGAFREAFANQKPEMEARPASQEPPMQSIAHH